LKKLVNLSKLLLLLIVLSSCQKTSLTVKTDPMERGLPDEISYNVRITQFIDNRNEYYLEAKRIERFTGRRMMYAYGVTLTTYDKNNLVNSTIQADTTIVDDARNIVEAQGHAKMTSPNGSLSTPKIIWDRAVDEITAPLNVTLVRDGSILNGSNLRTNSKLSFVEMDAVSAEGKVKPEEIDW
jgi:LPS export ABC transporter protein LptC